MNNDDLQEARTNPEFLNHLEQRRVEALENSNISILYEVMDSMLVLDLDEEKINQTYAEILKITFNKIDSKISNNEKFDLNSNDICYIRSLYEHSIEKWSYEDYDGANLLFMLLINLISDEKLINSLKVHLIACAREIDLDSFYENCVDNEVVEKDEKYGYFITNFKFDIDIYIEDNSELIQNKLQQLK